MNPFAKFAIVMAIKWLIIISINRSVQKAVENSGDIITKVK